MLDIRWMRENLKETKEALAKRGFRDADIDEVLAADTARRIKIKERDDAKAELNKLSDAIARLKGAERQKTIDQASLIKHKYAAALNEAHIAEEKYRRLAYLLPNLPLPDVPAGKDERDNLVLREVGDKPRFDFAPRDYMEIAAGLDIIDTERAAKVSGSRFGYIKGDLARMEFALAQFALDRLTAKGFIPIVPPVMVREEMMAGLGYIDTAEDRAERYELEKDKLFLVGTSEQSVVPMHAGEIFTEKDLPRRYAAFSSCFRREAGSYGKDTHGILRSHQFDKVEMVSFTKPEDSKKEHEFLLMREEELMQMLKLPYRVVALCAGDLSRPSAATFDIEAWLPGQNSGAGEYRETHSCSNTTDFQARRLNIKYEPMSRVIQQPDGSTSEFFEPVYPPTRMYVHILNGTAFAIGRTLIAILENYQQADGLVAVPEVLRPYMGGIREIRRQK